MEQVEFGVTTISRANLKKLNLLPFYLSTAIVIILEDTKAVENLIANYK